MPGLLHFKNVIKRQSMQQELSGESDWSAERSKPGVMNMAFELVFLVHAPDASPVKHRCVIETSKHRLFFAAVATDQIEAVEERKKCVKKGERHN